MTVYKKGENVPKWKYIVKKMDDSKVESFQNQLNSWAEKGLELVTLYPRGSSVVFVVFQEKIKE